MDTLNYVKLHFNMCCLASLVPFFTSHLWPVIDSCWAVQRDVQCRDERAGCRGRVPGPQGLASSFASAPGGGACAGAERCWSETCIVCEALACQSSKSNSVVTCCGKCKWRITHIQMSSGKVCTNILMVHQCVWVPHLHETHEQRDIHTQINTRTLQTTLPLTL